MWDLVLIESEGWEGKEQQASWYGFGVSLRESALYDLRVWSLRECFACV